MINLVKIAIGMVLATSAMHAQAENYLFSTDVLPEGDIDVQAQFSFLEYDQDEDATIFGLPLRATGKNEITNTNIRVRYGIGSNWHIGATLPHTNSESHYTTRSGSAFIIGGDKTRSTYTGNALLFAKYQFNLPEASPYTLSAGVSLAANTANNGYTGLETFLSAGYLLNNKARAYADLSTTFYDLATAANNEKLGIGVFYQFDPNLIFVPKYKLMHIHKVHAGGLTLATSRYVQSMGLEAQIRLATKIYLIPYFGFEYIGGSKNDFGMKTHDSDDGKNVSISLYHLF